MYLTRPPFISLSLPLCPQATPFWSATFFSLNQSWSFSSFSLPGKSFSWPGGYHSSSSRVSAGSHSPRIWSLFSRLCTLIHAFCSFAYQWLVFTATSDLTTPPLRCLLVSLMRSLPVSHFSLRSGTSTSSWIKNEQPGSNRWSQKHVNGK